jgi:hypothetical protein
MTAATPTLRLLIGASLLAMGCGPAPAADSPPIFPTTPGRWWYYATQVKVLDEPRHQRLFIANVAYDGRTLLQRRQGAWDHLYAIDDEAVAHQAYLNRQGGGRQAREAPAVLLPVPPKPGSTWQFKSRLRLIESRTFAAEDRLGNRYLPVELNASIAADDDVVQVPAGRYDDCVRIEATGVTLVQADRGTIEVEVKVTQTEWYAPGVGLVKSTRLEAAESPFLRNGEYRQELLEAGS